VDRLPSLNALRAFEQVARTGSVRAAADALHVTPSAVSHQLKRLEEDLGVVLLERSARHVVLTREGRAYADDLRHAFDRLAVATDRVRNRRDGNTVTVTTVPVFAVKWLVRRLADFHVLHPDVEVRVGTTYRTQDLSDAGYDLGIRWGSGRWPGLSASKLMDDVIQPVCSPGYLERFGPLDASRNTASRRLIHMDPDAQQWRLWFALHGRSRVDASRGIRFSEPTSAIQAAIDGLGAVLGPRALVEDDVEAGRLVPAHPQRILLHEAYHLVFPSRVGLSRTARLFAVWLAARCGEFDAGAPPPDLCLLDGGERRGTRAVT
jgi:LysR family glycine cleavage system transcriptional activator